MLPLERELINPASKCAVSIRKAGETVTPIASAFMRRACNKGLVEVTGTG